MRQQTPIVKMCGGVTVFTIFDMFTVRPTNRLGVVEPGGVGHLAIQFCAEWGRKVIVLSKSENKREDTLRLGATEFVVINKESKTLSDSKSLQQLTQKR